MLVTDQAKLIRTTVGDIRVAGRNTQGITIFRVGMGEQVVSAAKIDEDENPENEAEAIVAEERAAMPPVEGDIMVDDGTGPATISEKDIEE